MKKFWQREDFWEKFWERKERGSGQKLDKRLKVLVVVIIVGLFLNAVRILNRGDLEARDGPSHRETSLFPSR